MIDISILSGPYLDDVEDRMNKLRDSILPMSDDERVVADGIKSMSDGELSKIVSILEWKSRSLYRMMIKLDEIRYKIE
jgi:hypothetical protein